MASGKQSNVANMLGTVLKDLIANSWSNNSDNSSANKKKVVSESFKKNSKKLNKDDDANVKKVVETLEKLVDAKDDALGEEINRRKEAEQKVEELRMQLEKIQVASDTTEDKEQVKSTMMQLVDVLLEEHTSKTKCKSDSKRGGGHARGRGGRGGGASNRVNKQGDQRSQPGPAKFNNDSNIKSDKEDNTKVFNKLSFDDLAGTHKMQNDDKTPFFQQLPDKNINTNIGPIPSFQHSDNFHGAPVYGPGNQFPHPQQQFPHPQQQFPHPQQQFPHPQQLPNQYYMQPQFRPPNASFPPQNFPFIPPNFPAPPIFNFPPQQLNQLNAQSQNVGPHMSSDGVTLGGKTLSPQELNEIKQCLKNDKMNMPGHIQHNKANYKTRAQKQKQTKDKEGEKISGKENEGQKTAGKKNKGEKFVGKEKEGKKTAGKENEGEKAEVKTNKEENSPGKEKEGEKTAGKKKQGAGKINQVEKSVEEQDGDKDAQKSQEGSSTGARKKEPMEEKKQGKKKNKNKEASREGSKAVTPIQLLVRAGIPTEAEVHNKNIDINTPVKNFMLVAKDGDKPISEVPSTLRDMVNFRQKYPNAQAILIQDQ